MHNGLYKVKPYLNSLSEGLEVFKIASLMKIFPNLFEQAFISKDLCGTDIVQQIVPDLLDDNDHMLNLISWLFDYICELSLDGIVCDIYSNNGALILYVLFHVCMFKCNF